MIGDFEPEDAWHPGDPFDDLARNLRLRIAALDQSDGQSTRPWSAVTAHEQADEIERRLAPYIRRRLTLAARQVLRVDQLREDLGYLRSLL